MNVLCTICSDHVNKNENIFVTKCGHLFHDHCLVQWLERSKTCPQCRNKVTDKCMFRIYPTIYDLSAVNAGYLQSRLDNAILEVKKERELTKEKERQLEMVKYDLKKYKGLVKTYEMQIVSIESRLQSAKGELLFAQIEAKEAQKYKEENEELKKHMQTLNGLQTILNATSREVEQMLEGYSDMRTIATFASALKRALCESEAKKNEFRDKLFVANKELSLERKTEAELQNKIKLLEADLKDSASTIESLQAQLKTASLNKNNYKSPTKPSTQNQTPRIMEESVLLERSPGLNDAILECPSNNSSFNTMVNKIENSDSPYLNLKQGGGLLCLTALQRGAVKISGGTKPSQQSYQDLIKNANKKRVESQMTTSIFHRKEPMKIQPSDANSNLDISYDGMGGHSKPDTFPTPRRSPKNSPKKAGIPRLTAKHKLKRPNITGNQDIQAMFKKRKDQ
ncbi:unnamed protein product [Arctia plantaginis]|uniref:RING-type domain-containing protein n=1 Tax=Arctia plantaginis TaxID=874455 RepID=A0A8S0ZKS6_ARCPL|nr:unnamed protein product [Arctia plantaginis]CAB3238128.1 unnamed protein product [Arctia plantaginis]